MWPHTVAILTGGQSSRMGTPKHEVVLPNGMTMLEVMIEFAKNTAENIVLVGGTLNGYQSLQDSRHQDGPVAGIEVLLQSDIDTQYLVVGCDMPNMQRVDVEPLLQCDGTVAFSFDGRTLGLPIKVSKDCATTCTMYLDAGNRSIQGFVSQCTPTTIEIDSTQFDTLASVNSPEDIQRIFETNMKQT
jgi:molybdopterin-guanine dinucleotide biosynthesis protein A